MKSLSAFIIKINPLTEELESNLDREMFVAINANFTNDEQESNFIVDEENRTMIVFIEPSNKHKVDNVVNAARQVGPEVIGLYEDVTKKFLYNNDFSDYQINSQLITNYIKSNLTYDDVLNKVQRLGADKLTEVDKMIFNEQAA